ncbi:hypothetical protein DIPPA_27606 [Diplonema papillatum]|nr:hypothetical protein DIPPA_27606 [Diplonema papillatum]
MDLLNAGVRLDEEGCHAAALCLYVAGMESAESTSAALLERCGVILQTLRRGQRRGGRAAAALLLAEGRRLADGGGGQAADGAAFIFEAFAQASHWGFAEANSASVACGGAAMTAEDWSQWCKSAGVLKMSRSFVIEQYAQEPRTVWPSVDLVVNELLREEVEADLVKLLGSRRSDPTHEHDACLAAADKLQSLRSERLALLRQLECRREDDALQKENEGLLAENGGCRTAVTPEEARETMRDVRTSIAAARKQARAVDAILKRKGDGSFES